MTAIEGAPTCPDHGKMEISGADSTQWWTCLTWGCEYEVETVSDDGFSWTIIEVDVRLHERVMLADTKETRDDAVSELHER